MYWLEMPKVFEKFGVEFPLLVPRNSMLFLRKKTLDKIEKSGVALQDFLGDFQKFLNQKLLKESELNADLESREQLIKENFEILRYNLSNIRNSEIILENCALWSSNTNIKILNDFGDLLNWSFRVEKSNNPDDIKAYSLITLMNNYDFNLIDILKIDIEGSEKEIFTSENADVSFLEKTKCIAIEIHDEFDCREDIVRILEKYNFQWFNSGELTIGINQNLVNN
jgi:FkbM family methyltransferase